ncbi:M17 family metallopeptidase [Brumicola nitratireducens]|uniref:Putative cytosol aminopeptidase n=1 Tax=Glaciecola nitratireducens (strain JCM 12485 / KCTC 12276 / FR1064) TaxID=1085623 RepID=G4QJ50_GLANF|nr:leucyl aminopeptidase family protein [Glaciecola nitratireducens]AEP28918.1 putative cytosol aminopeptidase [Glaciecola nitratireducens FR1064]
MPFPNAVLETNIAQLTHEYDAYVLVSNTLSSQHYPDIQQNLEQHQSLDKRVGGHAVLVAADVVGGRLLQVPVGQLDRDYDDVRRIFDAARNVAQTLLDSGVRKPLLEINLAGLNESQAAQFKNAVEAAYLGLCQGLWQPLEARQALDEHEIEPIEFIGLIDGSSSIDVSRLNAIEAGKRIARDLCGTEPERMAPPGFADYCVAAFKGSNVKVTVVSDDAHIKHEYPLLHAVARASIEVKRHRPRIIRMVYEPSGEITKTLLFAGKGITFDTGGADLKVNGHMAGMSRDKGGAAGVAGFMKTLSLLAPKGIKVIAELGAVRNSIGAEAFIPDEIITSHAGVRVRVGNTDAEGRMLLADLLSHLREDAVSAVNPQLFSVATLTGHAAMAFGPYTALVENKPARDMGIAKQLFVQGELCADQVEPSLSRREDFDFVKPRTKADDVLSSNNAPSVTTMRGHQFPMAFLTIASGLDKHEASAKQPLPFTHVDIAGSGIEGLDWQHGKPTGAPVNVFVNTYL